MNKNTGTQGFWKGKGFYAALVLVIAGAALASFLAINSMMRELSAESAPGTPGGEENTWDIQQHTEVAESQSNIPITPSASSKPQSTASSQQPSSASSSGQPAQAAQQPAQAPSFVSPMAGEVLQAFSGDELVFNETMQDWRTHNGMDIRGGLNDGVHAPAAGTVTRAEEDAQWGGVVELTSGDVVIRLCGLRDIYVSEGEQVEQGATVGGLGEIPAESALETHLHVEMMQDGLLVDPASYFA